MPRTSARRPRGQEARKPTYGSATRLARLMLGLIERPHGWSFDQIQEELGIGERTLLRYIRACREEVTDRRGNPLVEEVRHGQRRLLRLAHSTRASEANNFEVMFFYFALAVFQFLEGTVLKDGVDGLWERFYKGLPNRQRLSLADMQRKFFVVPFATKDYRGSDAILDTIVQCLVRQRRMRVDYHGVVGEGRIHEFDPYTLVMYRGGLYVIGFSYVYHKVIYLAVERIRTVDTLEATFDYPARYSPARHTEGVFGIVDGPKCDVELQIMNRATVTYLKSRRLHSSQRFTQRPDGTTLLSMSVRGTTELVPWILSLGPYVQVLQPPALREEVADLYAQASRLYHRPARRSAPTTLAARQADSR